MNINIIFVILCFLGLLNLNSFGQSPDPVHAFSFSNCQIIDEVGSDDGEAISGNLNCQCGFDQSSLEFDGNLLVQLGSDSSNIGKILTQNEFAISIKILSPRNNNAMTVMSVNEDCDSFGWELVYNPVASEFIFRIRTQTQIITIPFEDDKTSCWQELIINRYFNKIEFFLNGKSVKTGTFTNNFDFSTLGQAKLGGGGCANVFFETFKGLIDEVKIYKRVINPNVAISQTKNNINFLSDHFHVLFPGQSYGVNFKTDCTNNITWIPAAGVSDQNSSIVELSPSESTHYKVTQSIYGCLSSDTVFIKLVDPASLNCEKLLCPNSFTPNDDFLNDEFGISNDYLIEGNFLFEIFDLHGALLFSTINTSEKWGGKIGNEKALPGIYLYKIKYKCSNETFSKSGSVNLIR